MSDLSTSEKTSPFFCFRAQSEDDVAERHFYEASRTLLRLLGSFSFVPGTQTSWVVTARPAITPACLGPAAGDGPLPQACRHGPWDPAALLPAWAVALVDGQCFQPCPGEGDGPAGAVLRTQEAPGECEWAAGPGLTAAVSWVTSKGSASARGRVACHLGMSLSAWMQSALG